MIEKEKSNTQDQKQVPMHTKVSFIIIKHFLYALIPGLAFFVILVILLHISWWLALIGAFVGIVAATVGFTMGYKSHMTS
jgi:ABC-type bacteriocin/lantibiotic exporter with double-glycine peptidase domain